MRLGYDHVARSPMAPEARLVLECCRISGDPGVIRALPGPGFNWHRVVDLASRDRVLPQVCEALGRHATDLVPTPITAEMRRRLFTHASNAILVTSELVSLMSSLAAQRIRALTFKGPALAAAAYGRVSLRMFNDVDVLVDDGDYERCCEFLASRGYSILRDYGFERTLRRDGTPAMVDLHRSVSPSAFPCALSFDELWRRRVAVALNDSFVDCLSPADHLMVLCVQITRDRWESKGSLAKLCDIARLVDVGAINWPAVLEEARARGFERRLLAVLAAAETMLAIPLSAIVTQRLEEQRRARKLGNYIGAEFLRKADNGLGQLAARIAFHFRIHERPGHKLAQLRMVPIKLREAWLAQT